MFTLDELIGRFDLAQVNRKSAHFDLAKCDWFNAQYMQRLDLGRYEELVMDYKKRISQEDLQRMDGCLGFWDFDTTNGPELRDVLALEQMKVVRLSEVGKRIGFFYQDDFPIEPDAAEKLQKPGAIEALTALRDAFAGLEDWKAATLEAKLKELAAARGVKVGELVHPARAAASGRTVGPSLYHMLEVLGKERVLTRFERALKLRS